MRALVPAALLLAGACTEPMPSADVQVFVGSTVTGDSIEAGRDLLGREADMIRERIRAARRRLPRGVLPEGVVRVHYAPRVVNGAEVVGLEVHRGTAAILGAQGAEAVSEAVWAHELVHVAWAAHRRPREKLAARVWDAMEEGAADHLAHLAGYDPEAARGDVERPSWEHLALADRFDPHPLGATFARALGQSGLSGVAISACFTPPTRVEDAKGPTEALAAWVRACPDDGAAWRAIEAWAPSSLLPPRSP